MNYMKQIAQMLGIELGEEFKIKDPKNGEIYNVVFKFDNSGLVRREPKPKRVWIPDSGALHQLIIGGFEVVKKPWKPKNDEQIYWVNLERQVIKERFDDHYNFDVMRYVLGNCFRSKEEITPQILEETWQKCYGAYFRDDEQDGAHQ